MKIMLANQLLQPVADFLVGMPLKAHRSRARSKLLTLVRQAIARFGVDEYELVTAYASLDDQGHPIFAEDGIFTLADPDKAREFLDARNNLMSSIAEVSGPTYEGHEQEIVQLLEDYDQELSGQAAEAYAALYDALVQDSK